jgi:NAD(P)H-hydrate epimerase
VIAADAADVIQEGLERATSLLVGPGFGVEETTLDFLRRLLGGPGHSRRAGIGFVHSSEAAGQGTVKNLPSLVVDADGLKLIAKLPNWPTRLPPGTVLTPHPGEMSVLTGLTRDEIQAGRWELAERFAKEWGHVVVLKGALTVIASPDGRTCVIPVASAAQARAGTGDVLAGLIAGLRAQGLPGYDAALAGAWIHAEAGLLAGDLLGAEASVLASDVLDAVSGILSGL